MGKMKKFLKSLIRSEKGATAIEYTLIAALISIVCIVAFRRLGETLNGKMTEISESIVNVKFEDKNNGGIP